MEDAVALCVRLARVIGEDPDVWEVYIPHAALSVIAMAQRFDYETALNLFAAMYEVSNDTL